MCVQDHQSHINASVLNAKHRSDKFKDYHPVSDANLPDSIDWRTGGAVVKVKDQVIPSAITCYFNYYENEEMVVFVNKLHKLLIWDGNVYTACKDTSA